MRTILPAPSHLSHSQVSALLPSRRYSCGLRWSLTRRLGYAEAPSSGMALGSALDSGLNAMLRPVVEGGRADLLAGIAAMMASLEDSAPNFPADPGWARTEGTWLELALKAFYPTAPTALETVQLELSFRTGATEVRGWVDRVDRDAEGPVVVDHKLTATRPWDSAGEWDADWVAERIPQLALYAGGLAILEPDRGPWTRGRLVVCYGSRRLKTPQWNTIDLALTPEAIAAALDDVQTAQAIADSGVYPATPGQHCGWCSVTAPCATVLAMTAPSIVDVAAAL